LSNKQLARDQDKLGFFRNKWGATISQTMSSYFQIAGNEKNKDGRKQKKRPLAFPIKRESKSIDKESVDRFPQYPNS